MSESAPSPATPSSDLTSPPPVASPPTLPSPAAASPPPSTSQPPPPPSPTQPPPVAPAPLPAEKSTPPPPTPTPPSTSNESFTPPPAVSSSSPPPPPPPKTVSPVPTPPPHDSASPPPPPLPASSPPPTPASDSKFPSPPLDAPVVVTAPPSTPISTPSPPSPPTQTTPPDSPLSPPATSTPAPSTTAAPPPPVTPTQTNTPPPPAHSSLRPPTTSSTKNSTASPSTTPSAHSNDNTVAKTLVGIAVAGVLVALAVIFFVALRKKKRSTNGSRSQYRHPPGQIARPNSKKESVFGSNGGQFTYDELMGITSGFSRDNHIGEGGFGPVYKGTVPDGRQVAVKQLKIGSGQGEREFRAEVEIISRIHHRHLVSLVGYCIVEHHRLLVYEFVSNKTLEHHLHGEGLPVLDWAKRTRIAIGSARGLAYLHEDCHPRIIHRDIKYLAPEYASSGKLTDRSDVYSFGVVLLELITGRKPVDPSQPLGDESLVEWARPLLVHALETGEYEELVDPKLENNFAKNDMLQMIEAAAACVRHSAPRRPRMVQVLRALDGGGSLPDLSNGVKFGQSTVYDSGKYSADIQKLQKIAFGSNTFSIDYDHSVEHAHDEQQSVTQTQSSNGV
ncbi:hypothetical protein C4D60_Mb01t17120 [Musa balbisiana]|uniref:non-specific serine/threonine protein kinase n=1 Tax=Musa balbisiana TaxID=52838 RepID=A0A4S8JN20_MUSBA|nr:hypothetical protein C4D60_Mb01t17120 [Musa balbisiana]